MDYVVTVSGERVVAVRDGLERLGDLTRLSFQT